MSYIPTEVGQWPQLFPAVNAGSTLQVSRGTLGEWLPQLSPAMNAGNTARNILVRWPGDSLPSASGASKIEAKFVIFGFQGA